MLNTMIKLLQLEVFQGVVSCIKYLLLNNIVRSALIVSPKHPLRNFDYKVRYDGDNHCAGTRSVLECYFRYFDLVVHYRYYGWEHWISQFGFVGG